MRKAILLTCVLLGTASLSLFLHNIIAKPSTFFTTVSPNKDYEVSLSGKKYRPSLPFTVNEVRFDVLRSGKLTLTNKHLHSGGWFDPSFDDFYPKHQWISESILQFYKGDLLSEEKRDTLIIENTTSEMISYLRVNSTDLFLVFNLQPKSRMKLLAFPQTWLSWLAAEGEFSNGQGIRIKGENFYIGDKLIGPFQYHISVGYDGLTIESKQLEKYKNTNSDD